MLGYIYGINSTDKRTMDLDQFRKALRKFDIDFDSDSEFELLFKHIDNKKDGKIDLSEWNEAFSQKGILLQTNYGVYTRII